MRACVLRRVPGRAAGEGGGADVPSVPRGPAGGAGRAVGPSLPGLHEDLRHGGTGRGEPARLKQVFDKLSVAKRPVLIGGHGVWWSEAEQNLEEAGRKLGIPVFNIPYHQKLLGEECEAYMGLADIHQYHPSKDAFQETDLVLMVGARLDNQLNWSQKFFLRFENKAYR